MPNKGASEAFSFYSNRIVELIETAFEDIRVATHEVERGAVRLTIHPRLSA